MLKDSAVIDFFSNEVALVKINAEEDSVLAKEHHISGFPTLVMLDKDGKEIDRLVGYLPPEEFVQKFRDYAQGIGTLEDLLSRASQEVDRELYLEIAEKYKHRGGAKEARNWYQKVLDEGDVKDSLAGESRMALADLLRYDKKEKEAIEAYQKITKEFPGTWFADDAEVWMAIIYKKMGDTTEAVKRFEAYIKAHPEGGNTDYCKKQIEKIKEARTAPKEEAATDQ